MERKYADGRIQAQISMKAHRFLRDHRFSQHEPLYVTLDRIIAMYGVKDVAPVVEELRKVEMKWKNAVEYNDKLERENQYLKRQLEKYDSVKDRTLGEFLQ